MQLCENLVRLVHGVRQFEKTAVLLGQPARDMNQESSEPRLDGILHLKYMLLYIQAISYEPVTIRPRRMVCKQRVMTAAPLRGQRIAITGAGRGIGLATAKALYQRGATIVIGDLDRSSATAAAGVVGPGTVAYRLDVSDYESFAAFHEQACADAPLDVLINNAGIMPIGRFLDQTADKHRRAVEINVMGCINGMHLALPAIVERGSGHIINIASSAGKTPVPGGLTYCGTKAVVIALTETARVEYAYTGVQFTCVMPAFTNTELIAGTSGLKFIPVVQPEDVARAIAGALAHPTADVFVPKISGPILTAQPLLGRRVRDLVNRRIGAHNTFLDFDPKARADYQHRIDES
jgi:NAD(P)-dependent dehydrogenase (short-subunit alcohol dehydrogenase family)